jgi:hypothetical protein
MSPLLNILSAWDAKRSASPLEPMLLQSYTKTATSPQRVQPRFSRRLLSLHMPSSSSRARAPRLLPAMSSSLLPVVELEQGRRARARRGRAPGLRRRGGAAVVAAAVTVHPALPAPQRTARHVPLLRGRGLGDLSWWWGSRRVRQGRGTGGRRCP